VFTYATEWLTEALKRYDDYYDQHQVKAVDILEQLAVSLIGNNRVADAEKVIEKVLRMNAKSHVKAFLKVQSLDWKKVQDAPMASNRKHCHSVHYLSNAFTCPI